MNELKIFDDERGGSMVRNCLLDQAHQLVVNPSLRALGESELLVCGEGEGKCSFRIRAIGTEVKPIHDREPGESLINVALIEMFESGECLGKAKS